MDITTTIPEHIIALYGGMFVYQFSQTLDLYQTDNACKLQYVDTITSGQRISNLLASPDGRHFGFIASQSSSPDECYVYFLDTLSKELSMVFTCEIPSKDSVFTFSQDNQFIVLTHSGNRVIVKQLYSDEAEITLTDTHDATIKQQSALLPSRDYVVWHKSNGDIRIIDLVNPQTPNIWNDTLWLNPEYSTLTLVGDHIVHISNSISNSRSKTDTETICTILFVNSLTQRLQLATWNYPLAGYTRCVGGPDNKLYFWNDGEEDCFTVEIPATKLIDCWTQQTR